MEDMSKKKDRSGIWGWATAVRFDVIDIAILLTVTTTESILYTWSLEFIFSLAALGVFAWLRSKDKS